MAMYLDKVRIEKQHWNKQIAQVQNNNVQIRQCI